jgi:hypothetical protein
MQKNLPDSAPDRERIGLPIRDALRTVGYTRISKLFRARRPTSMDDCIYDDMVGYSFEALNIMLSMPV